jgi:hypothetical protein
MKMPWVESYGTRNRYTCDSRFPLEVTFTGENARDFGGPRREFLSEVHKRNLCVENKEDGEGGYFLHDNVTARTNQFYVGGGIIFGIIIVLYHSVSFIFGLIEVKHSYSFVWLHA